jgi:hypothetical protein
MIDHIAIESPLSSREIKEATAVASLISRNESGDSIAKL